MDQPLDRLVQGHARGDEDREHHREPGDLLRPKRAKEERDPDRHRGERVADVMDQIGQQRNRARQDEDHGLHERRGAQDSEAERDGLEARARAHDGTVYKAMQVPVLAMVVMLVLMLAGAGLERLRPLNEPEMSVRASVGVLMDPVSVAMQRRRARAAHAFNRSQRT
jgi:hypothetical protein